jgi:putative transcriptional regulator
MTIVHHPTDVLLSAYASRTLDEARALVVATHLSFCPRCRAAAGIFEEAGGVLLEAAEPVPMAPDALQRAMARLDRDSGAASDAAARAARPAAPGVALDDEDIRLPAPLLHYPLGSWRRLGRGVQYRAVDVASDQGVRVFMLKAEPGTKLPRHTHTGTEWTCVFEGAFRHDCGRYGPGDFDEADDSIEHDPVVDNDVACLCLVAMQGTIRLQSLLGQLIQPFLRL